MKQRSALNLIISATCFLAACNNKGSTPNIIGHWQMTGYAVDANSNKVMDAPELHRPEMQLSFSFLKNGHGAILDRGRLVDSIRWSLHEGDWMGQVDGSGKAWYYHIDSVSDKRIVLRDTIEGTIWEVLEKG
ncbi:MAG: hypothetical protein JSS82_20540 [Bacteroidetes bacterium]|nr:hypothetical protein [Bacteroidota bacterium]